MAENEILTSTAVETEYDAKELTRYLNLFLKGLSSADRYLFMRRYWHNTA